MARDILHNYRGLESFLDPDSFRDYLRDIGKAVENHFGCTVYTRTLPKDLCIRLGAYLDQGLVKRDLWMFINLLTKCIQRHGDYHVMWRKEPGADCLPFIDVLTSYPSEVIAVGMAVATIRHELGVDLAKCQISRHSLAEIARRLGRDPDGLILDQTDLLEGCLQYVT